MAIRTNIHISVKNTYPLPALYDVWCMAIGIYIINNMTMTNVLLLTIEEPCLVEEM